MEFIDQKINMFETIVQENTSGTYPTDAARKAAESLHNEGYLLASTENIEKTLMTFLEHFAPSTAKGFAKDSKGLAEDFRNMLGEIPVEVSK